MIRLPQSVLAAFFVLLVIAPPRAVFSDDSGIAAFLTQSARDWNDGRLDAFMRGYENSPATLYIGSKTVIHGYAAIRAQYASHYGTSHMGVLSFSGLTDRLLGTDYAVVVGHWHLAMTNGTHPTGIFSLVLHRSPAGWRIIDDHTP